MNEIYTTDIFDNWLENLRDKKAQGIIRKRIRKAELGNLGSVKALRGGLWEMKIDFAGGYRIYYTQVGKITYLLVAGGDKSSQEKDIETSLKIIKELNL